MLSKETIDLVVKEMDVSINEATTREKLEDMRTGIGMAKRICGLPEETANTIFRRIDDRIAALHK